MAVPPGSGFGRVTNLGKPLLVGLPIAAVLTGLLTYALTSLTWRWRTLAKRRSRMRQNATSKALP